MKRCVGVEIFCGSIPVYVPVTFADGEPPTVGRVLDAERRVVTLTADEARAAILLAIRRRQ